MAQKHACTVDSWQAAIPTCQTWLWGWWNTEMFYEYITQRYRTWTCCYLLFYLLVWPCSLEQRIFVDRICYNMLQPQMHRKNRASKTSLQMGKASKTYENPRNSMNFQGNQHPQIASIRTERRRLFSEIREIREFQRQKSVTVAQCLVNMDSPPAGDRFLGNNAIPLGLRLHHSWVITDYNLLYWTIWVYDIWVHISNTVATVGDVNNQYELIVDSGHLWTNTLVISGAPDFVC